MKLTSICTAISLLVLSAYAAVIPFYDVTEFSWPKHVQTKSFSVDIKSPTRVQVLDFNKQGEGFYVYDNGYFVGETGDAPLHIQNKYQFNQGFFKLETGHHVIDLKLKADSNGKDNGVIRLLSGTIFVCVLRFRYIMLTWVPF